MCYTNDQRPPDAPGATGKARGEDIELTAKDGTRVQAYYAQAEQPTVEAQVLIYPDVRGLHDFYRALAMRFAEAGINALAFDYFGRTAGLTSRDDSFEYMPHVQQMQLDTLVQDVQAGLAYLHEHAQNSSEPVFAVGFCRGGTLSLYSATQDLGLAGVVAFYAGLGRPLAEGKPTMLEEAENIKLPVLGLFGGADQGIPAEQVRQLEATLEKNGVEHKIKIYEGAPHSFFDRKAEEFAEASADSWQQTLDFIRAHSPQAVSS